MPFFRNSFLQIGIAAIVAMNIFVFVLYYKNQQISDSSGWVQHTYEVMAENDVIFASLQDMSTAQRGYLLSGRKEFLDPYHENQQTIDQHLAHLKIQVQDNPSQLLKAGQLAEAVHAQQAIMNSQINRYDVKSSTSPLTVEDIVASKTLMDRLRQLNKDIRAEEQGLLKLRTEKEKALQDNYTLTILLSSLLSIVMLGAAIVVVYLLDKKRLWAESGLQDSEERFALALQGMQDGIYDWFPQKDQIYYSLRLKDMIGETDRSMPDTIDALKERIHPEDREKTLAVFEDYRAEGKDKPYLNVFRLRHRNGSYRTIMSRGTGIWKAGQLHRLIGAHTDITEQRQYADNLKKINEELETFTYIASHDLRSPLVNLKGFAGEMQLGLDELKPVVEEMQPRLSPSEKDIFQRVLAEDIPDALGFIHSSVVKMDRLTNGILELSRIGRRDLRVEPIDVEQLVNHALGALAHQIHEKGITVETGKLPPVNSDPLSIEQVFGNLIDNAIKYLDPSRPGHLLVSGETMGDVNLYRVADNGRGIAAVDMQKIFEIFRRAGNNDGIAGEGMGMAYVKASLRRLGGTIWCESVHGEGTTFFFTVPNPSLERNKS